jgi:hypothetical protein
MGLGSGQQPNRLVSLQNGGVLAEEKEVDMLIFKK